MDVEDLSMANLLLDNGVYVTYQQCHFTPDYWRNYTVIGTARAAGELRRQPGRRGEGVEQPAVRVPRGRRLVVEIPDAEGGHGGADPRLVAEFIRFVRDGGATLTSPVAARAAVAAGYAATTSLRSNGTPIDVPPLDPALVAISTTARLGEGATIHDRDLVRRSANAEPSMRRTLAARAH